jgi:trimethylamine--corrinoid protein Co-methyltransferase
MRQRTTWLSDAEKALIVDEALSLLERVGMRMTGSRALDGLAAAGATVDAASGIVRFPPQLVREAMERCPRDVLMAGATPAQDVLLGEGEGSHFCSSGCGAFVLDDDTGERRLSTLADLSKATALLDASPEVDLIWTTVTANDVPLEVRELTTFHTMLTQSDKHVTFVDCPSRAEPLLRMGEIIVGDAEAFRARPRFSTLLTAASPLQVDGDTLDFHISVAARGVPIEVYTIPMSGATAPVTMAASVTLAVAEFMGVATAMQTASPGARLVFGASSNIMDMRAARVSYGAPESLLMAAASIEVGHELGVPVAVPGLGTDAKHPGIQAGYEKAFRAMTSCAAGADVITGGVGMLDAVDLLYLPQIVVDCELAGMIRRLLDDVPVTHDEIMGEMVERVGVGGHFLGEKETRRRVRAGEQFRPAVSTRVSYDAWKTDGRTEVDVARERVAAMLAAREDWRPALSDDQLAELAAVCGVAPSA